LLQFVVFFVNEQKTFCRKIQDPAYIERISIAFILYRDSKRGGFTNANGRTFKSRGNLRGFLTGQKLRRPGYFWPDSGYEIVGSGEI